MSKITRWDAYSSRGPSPCFGGRREGTSGNIRALIGDIPAPFGDVGTGVGTPTDGDIDANDKTAYN
jgi:hypothetical protein